MVSVDYTYQKGTRGLMTLDINPLVNGAPTGKALFLAAHFFVQPQGDTDR